MLPGGDFILTRRGVDRTFGFTSVDTSGETTVYGWNGLFSLVHLLQIHLFFIFGPFTSSGGLSSQWSRRESVGALELFFGILTRSDINAIKAVEMMKSYHDFNSIISVELLVLIQKCFSILDEVDIT
ncbi:hypothetical protein BHM03_00003879 [Ensete ventricosum]|uniref:Uncharacterized protein n=1 Tax=Ensete ventricosum TaxID=4639 RepID=A0A445MA93_ENSVE|nr:hypothetical protein BHM03_00003879 [Ensete ventricosum]